VGFKREFYSKYVSTHIAHRKGDPTLEEFRSRAEYFQKKWRHLFPSDRNARIIDVGCGNGSLIWWLQRSGYKDTEGIDTSNEQVQVAHDLGVENVKQSDLRAYLLDRPETYDVIVLRDVVEHFEREEIIDIFKICRKALRSSGKIIIQVPNASAPFFGRIRYGDFTHEIAFTSSSLAQVLKMLDMSNIRFYGTEPAGNGYRAMVRLLLWKVVEAFYRFLLYAELGRGSYIVTQGIIAVATKDREN
jgi:2-polyprenyl-3-methyl-5-hydroxy-6-metoxy-1,4-benzoquinol methylase